MKQSVVRMVSVRLARNMKYYPLIFFLEVFHLTNFYLAHLQMKINRTEHKLSYEAYIVHGLDENALTHGVRAKHIRDCKKLEKKLERYYNIRKHLTK